MSKARFAAFPIGLMVAGSALSQTPPPAASAAAAPMGMTLQQYLSIARGRIMDRDADGDGKISAAEFANAAAGRRGPKAKAKADAMPAPDAAPATAGAPAEPAPGQMVSRMFDRFDTNHDGFLDKTEIDALLTRRFERMDANHDGIVTAEERQAGRGSMRGRMGAEQ